MAIAAGICYVIYLLDPILFPQLSLTITNTRAIHLDGSIVFNQSVMHH